MRVDNQAIRWAVEKKMEAGTTSLYQVADWLGYPRPKQEQQRIARALGMQGSFYKGKKYYNRNIDHDLAVRIIRACHIDPFEVGL